MNHTEDKHFLSDLRNAMATDRLLTAERSTRRHCFGIRVGGGVACTVAVPNTLYESWQVLNVCVIHNKIILVQVANTGLTGGSTPDGDDYDRGVVIIRTLFLDKLILLVGKE